MSLRYSDTYDLNTVAFSTLAGKTIKSINGMEADSERVDIELDDGAKLVMGHMQDCCESVRINSVDGDPSDLVGSPLLMAEESTKDGEKGEYGGSSTWTFYKFATIRGYVTLRWLGESNGYYSEAVDMYQVTANKD